MRVILSKYFYCHSFWHYANMHTNLISIIYLKRLQSTNQALFLSTARPQTFHINNCFLNPTHFLPAINAMNYFAIAFTAAAFASISSAAAVIGEPFSPIVINPGSPVTTLSFQLPATIGKNCR